MFVFIKAHDRSCLNFITVPESIDKANSSSPPIQTTVAVQNVRPFVYSVEMLQILFVFMTLVFALLPVYLLSFFL